MNTITHPAHEAVKIPTPGRIVHYFHNGHDHDAAVNNAEFWPAIVAQAFGVLHANLQIFTMNPGAMTILGWSVPHKSEVTAENPTAYWDWPEIK